MTGSRVRGTATVLNFIADGDIGIGAAIKAFFPSGESY
jgi:hypothetical protein